MFTPPFPIIVRPIFCDVQGFCCFSVGGDGDIGGDLIGLLFWVVDVVVCYQFFFSLAASSPPLGVRLMPSPLRMSRVSSTLIFWDCCCFFLQVRVYFYRLISLLASLFFSGRALILLFVVGLLQLVDDWRHPFCHPVTIVAISDVVCSLGNYYMVIFLGCHQEVSSAIT